MTGVQTCALPIYDIHDTSSKFKSLNEELKQCKKYNKNFERRLQTEDHNFQKQHEYLINLQNKLVSLNLEKIKWKNAIAKELPAPSEDNKTKKRSQETLFKSALTLLQKRLKTEKIAAVKSIEVLKAEIEKYKRKIKEAEKEHRLSLDKLSELDKQVKHKLLKPLEDKKEGSKLICKSVDLKIEESNKEIHYKNDFDEFNNSDEIDIKENDEIEDSKPFDEIEDNKPFDENLIPEEEKNEDDFEDDNIETESKKDIKKEPINKPGRKNEYNKNVKVNKNNVTKSQAKKIIKKKGNPTMVDAEVNAEEDNLILDEMLNEAFNQ